MRSWRKSLITLVTCAAATGAGFVGFNVFEQAQFAWAKDKVEATRQQLSTVQDLSTVFRHVGQVVEPSVVNINVRKSVKVHVPDFEFKFRDDPWFRQFFPDRDGDGQPDMPRQMEPRDENRIQVGTGSGVIMEAGDGVGYIVTNNHVAGGATEMTITLSDGRQFTHAKVLGTDAKSDLAVIEIKADHLIAAKWGNSDQMQKGDWVLAFGSPFGYVGSMTHGIVSALNRHAGILGSEGYENFIQVDAPINPGNSGGPLVNIHGEVVGINTAIATRSGGFQGIGFAIPSNQAKYIYKELKEKGQVTRGFLGISISDVSDNLPLAHSFGYKGNDGVLVQETAKNGPASGKLRPSDIITQMNSNAIPNVQALRSAVAETVPGTEVKFEVFRDGKDVDVSVKIGTQPENMRAAFRGQGSPQTGPNAGNQQQNAVESLGLHLQDMTPSLAPKYGLGDLSSGALIVSVSPQSEAARQGLRPGDVITRVNSTKTASAQEAVDAINKADAKKNGVRLYITSRQGSRFVFLQPEQPDQ